jgi:hypothetical protein
MRHGVCCRKVEFFLYNGQVFTAESSVVRLKRWARESEGVSL